MSRAEDGFYEVAIGKRAVYVRVFGLASMTNCLCVRDFIEKMLVSGHRFVVVDLAECTGMDSTFMGVLAGTATSTRDKKTVGVAVVNAGKSLQKLLKSVGIAELVFVDPEPFETPEIEFLRLAERGGEEERIALIRSAHQHLLKASERNAELFRPLLKALEAEMVKKGML